MNAEGTGWFSEASTHETVLFCGPRKSRSFCVSVAYFDEYREVDREELQQQPPTRFGRLLRLKTRHWEESLNLANPDRGKAVLIPLVFPALVLLSLAYRSQSLSRFHQVPSGAHRLRVPAQTKTGESGWGQHSALRRQSDPRQVVLTVAPVLAALRKST